MIFLNGRNFLLFAFWFLTNCLPGVAQDLTQHRATLRQIDSIQYMQNNPGYLVERMNANSNTKKNISHTTQFSGSTASPAIHERILSGMNLRGMSICFDTSGRYILQNDTIRYNVRGTSITADGSLLLCGDASRYILPSPSLGFLMKCSDSGSVQWIRLYDSSNHISSSIIYYFKSLELTDGSILLTGRTYNIANDNYDILLTRVDNAGNIIWSKTYKSIYWKRGVGSADAFTITQMQQDALSGDVYFTASHWEKGIDMTRLNIVDGSIVWSKAYHLSSQTQFDIPFGLSVNSNDLVAFEKFSSYYYSGTFIGAYRIDKNSGDTLATKFFRVTNSQTSFVGFLGTEELVKTNNGHYVISGKLHGGVLGIPLPEYMHAAVVEFDSNLDFVKGYQINNGILGNVNGTRISVFKDGSGVFSMHPFISFNTTDIYYVQFKDGQILKQRKKRYTGNNIRYADAPLRLPDGSDIIVKGLNDSVTNIVKIELLHLHLSDTASECIGWDDNSNFITPYSLDPFLWRLDSIGRNILQPTTNKTLGVSSALIDRKPGCQTISDCDTLSLIASSDTICLSESLLLTFKKNPGCGAMPFIGFDTSRNDSYRKLNDSTYQFLFKTPGTKIISGSIFGCRLITDSIKITVLRSPGNVMLGADTMICPGNTIRVRPGMGYSSYLWQDGSVDSVFVVQQPGEYYVRATDACGNIFFDTISINAHPPIPFDIGADSSICERDTVTITAPTSFINYKWFPDYQISSLVSSSVKVSPHQDTIYYVSAEKTPGCFVYDSIKIHVNKSTPIDLGPDKSFCSGDSVVLDAGSGFNKYIWNNGGTGQRVAVYNSGTYSVTAIAVNGCKSSDNFRVINVFANPLVNIGSNTYLCEGTPRVLSAGNFVQYVWNTGQTDKNIAVDKPGSYWVTVTDNNNCKGADTLVINKVVSPPAAFLPADTVICTYGNFLLKPKNGYNSYSWSTNHTGSSINISSSGTYWLQVQDQFNCIGRDSIVVSTKDCMVGFYIPNVFSPNDDGKNDIFRPLIFGNLLKYEFVIYNRWGQPIFRSQDIRKGWNGKYSIMPGNTSTYVWVCTYQIENEPVKQEKGTVTLVK